MRYTTWRIRVTFTDDEDDDEARLAGMRSQNCGRSTRVIPSSKNLRGKTMSGGTGYPRHTSSKQHCVQ